MQNSLNSSVKTKIKERGARFLFIFGTRPEAIKLAPLILKLRDIGSVQVFVTGQHKERFEWTLA